MTDKYYEDKKNGKIVIPEEAVEYRDSVIAILDSIYDSRAMQPENARKNNVELKLDRSKLGMPEFKKLWSIINSKSVYVVDFDQEELIEKAISALNLELRVSNAYVKVESGSMIEIQSKASLLKGEAFAVERQTAVNTHLSPNAAVKYDLIGKIVEETGLTRKSVAQILRRLEISVFNQFHSNPEDFLIKASRIINEQKATVIIEHITYNKLESFYDTSVFTEPTLKGQLGVNAIATRKHLYDHLLYDSANEKTFAEKVDTSGEVAVYVKLPNGFYINTPVGKYNPDWAIAFQENEVKHIYFVAETKGSLSTMQLRPAEEAKIHCAREHFKAISSNSVKYDVVDSYEELLNKVMS